MSARALQQQSAVKKINKNTRVDFNGHAPLSSSSLIKPSSFWSKNLKIFFCNANSFNVRLPSTNHTQQTPQTKQSEPPSQQWNVPDPLICRLLVARRVLLTLQWAIV